MSLVFILNELRKKGHLKKLSIIHINHSLRGKESDKDESIVKQFGKKLRIPIHVFTVDTKAYSVKNKIGIEEAARSIRYEKFISLASKEKITFVATAHTANDQAETVLMNIVRGSGINGLQGIPEIRKLSSQSLMIRPMLSITKSDILPFAKENTIPFREDKSNNSLDFQRNRIRHLVLPVLETAFKDRDIYSGFSKMTENIASVAKYIEDEVQALHESAIVRHYSIFSNRKILSYKKDEVLNAPVFLRRELILQAASSLSGKLISVDQVHSLLMESYLTYSTDKTYTLSKDTIIAHDGEYITIEMIEPPPSVDHQLIINKRVQTPIGFLLAKKVKGWNKSSDPNTVFFKYDELKDRKLIIRYWKPGDRMKPFGMKGKSRLVSDVLSEAGIKSERLKYFVPLIVLKDDPEHILWVPGIRSAEFGRLSSKSETAMQIKRII